MNCICPACGSNDVKSFYRQTNAPVHSVLIHHDRQEALSLSTGQIHLGFCRSCEFIYNTTFEASLQDYSLDYESTQACSPTFTAFADQLAGQLVERYNLRGKDIIEIGCGQGEFLRAICRLGANRGLGFDPAYQPERKENEQSDHLEFIRDYYSEKYATLPGDFIVCKMTLEHIQPVHEFVATIRRAIDRHPNPVVFFQVPDVTRILQETAFWDIYYEHCSYFSPNSLAALFRSAGFEILNLERAYDGQYLTIEARPEIDRSRVGAGSRARAVPVTASAAIDPTDIPSLVGQFTRRAPQHIAAWRNELAALHKSGKRVVLWGGGSKAVAFLTAISDRQPQNEVPQPELLVSHAVDINPRKHATYIAGAGIPVIAPSDLPEIHPDLVLIMNPIYYAEVNRLLAEVGLSPRLRAITEGPAQ